MSAMYVYSWILSLLPVIGACIVSCVVVIAIGDCPWTGVREWPALSSMSLLMEMTMAAN